MEIQKRIQEMRGKRYQYRNYNVLFESVQLKGRIYLFDFKHPNGSPLIVEKDLDQVESFLNCLTLITEKSKNIEPENINDDHVETLPAKQPNYMPPILRDNRDLLISLKDMLVEDMKKCRTDKSYIPQAKQACNTANSIINLAKLEIMMLRAE